MTSPRIRIVNFGRLRCVFVESGPVDRTEVSWAAIKASEADHDVVKRLLSEHAKPRHLPDAQ